MENTASFTTNSPLPNFRNFSKEELKAYQDWFRSIIPERVRKLSEMVKSTPGFELWVGDLTPKSLEALGYWFASHVETRKRSPREVAGITSRSPYPIDIPEDELTAGTFAMSHDVGIYLAEVLQHNYPALHWIQISGSKQKIEFGHMGLSGFGKVDFSPVHIVITLAYGVSAKTKGGERLRELYDVWSRMIK
jgi:hypothetical protein